MKVFLATIISVFSVLFILSPWGESLNRLYYDSLFNIRGARDSGQNIAIVSIDEASFDELDKQWPWPRSIHGKLVKTLNEKGAKVIGFDLLFSEPSIEREDQGFAEILDQYPNTVLVNEISQDEDTKRNFTTDKITDPVPIIEKAKQKINLGFANVLFDPDGFIRSFNYVNGSEKAFSYQIANLFKPSTDKPKEQVEFINYLGPKKTIDTVSFYQALDPDKYLPKDFFRGKIVLVGFAVASKAEIKNSPADHYPVPFSKWSGGLMPGVEIHAHAVENFLNNSFIKFYDRNLIFCFSIGLGILGGWMLFSFRPLVGSLIFIAINCFLFLIAYLKFTNDNLVLFLPTLILPYLACFVASPIFHYLTTRKEKAFIRKAFSTYLAPRLVEELIRNPEKLELGGEEKEGTVLFLDIAGFTALSEKLSARELIQFVNLYLGTFAEEIIQLDGMIDKYIGDCIMAVWGVPIFDEEHGTKAVKAILKIKKQLLELNQHSENLRNITFRAGITSGTMLTGNVGGGRQFNYTVLGNEVNLASRLESLNKYYDTNVLISERTAQTVRDKFVLRLVDEVNVKGQKKNEKIFEVCGNLNELSENYLAGLKLFEKSRELYSNQNWPDAIKSFKEVLMSIPHDGPSKVMISRCEKFRHKPPVGTWNGVFEMKEK